MCVEIQDKQLEIRDDKMVSFEFTERNRSTTETAGDKKIMRNKYMENRKNISIITDTYEKLVEIRKDMELKSLTEAINELIAIKEKVVTGKSFQCKKCGESVEIFPGTKPEKIGLIHSHVANTDCPGCIKMGYVLKDKANDTITKNDKSRIQTDANEKKETNEEMYKRLEENTKRLFPEKKLETSLDFTETDEE